MKRYLYLGLVLTGSLFVVIGGRMYYTHRYIPVRAVHPIVKLLDEGSRNSIEDGVYRFRGFMVVQYRDGSSGMERDPNRIKLLGAEAEEVKRALLRAMEKATDPESLCLLLSCVNGARGDGNILFRGEREWDIIKAVVERFNARPGQTITFTIAPGPDGVNWLSLDFPPIP
jgi:hypothetical protein